jgi:hypothetical protein
MSTTASTAKTGLPVDQLGVAGAGDDPPEDLILEFVRALARAAAREHHRVQTNQTADTTL